MPKCGAVVLGHSILFQIAVCLNGRYRNVCQVRIEQTIKAPMNSPGGLPLVREPYPGMIQENRMESML